MRGLISIKQGDTRPALRHALDVSGDVRADGVRAFFSMSSYRGVVVRRAECTIEDGHAVYLWQPCDTAVQGVYHGEFTVVYADGGIETDPENGYLQITIERALADPVPAPPPPLPDTAPDNTALPAMTGIARAGELLTLVAGAWSGRPAPVVVTAIEAQRGADGEITLVEASGVIAFEGLRYRAVEEAINAAGSAFARSGWTAIASAALAAPVNTVLPTLEGDLLDGEMLTGSEGVWTGNPVPGLQAVIQRQQGEGGSINVAAQGLTVIAEAGWRYRIEVFATNGVGAPVVSAASEWSDVVTAGVQPLAGYLDAPNVTVLGASHASGSFGIRTHLNDTLAARFARRGWSGTLRSFAQGGSNIAGARQQWEDALALPEVAAAVGRNVWIIDSAGNDIGAHLPYPNRADFVRDSLRALVEDIQATGDKVIFLPQTKRYAPWSGLTEASNLETDGILPYNLGIIHPLIAELTPDWADADGRAYVDPYKLADAYRAIVGNDGNHGYGQNLADFVLGKATNRIKALDPAAPRQGSIIWGARTTTQAYAYGNRNELNPAQGGPDIVEANNLARFNYMVGAGKTDGGVDDFVTFKMGPFGGRAGGPGIGGAGRVADPLMATAETLGNGWYVQDLNAGFVEIHGLAPASQVQLSIVAASTSSTGRTGRYTLTGGEQVTVDATTVSPSNYHKFAPIAVPADGKVRLDFVSAPGAGGFALLNALRLDYL